MYIYIQININTNINIYKYKYIYVYILFGSENTSKHQVCFGVYTPDLGKDLGTSSLGVPVAAGSMSHAPGLPVA